MTKILKLFPFIFLAIFTLFIYKPFIFEGKVPIPADTIVGLYHPWRDFFSKDYPSGIPFKNFQITDSVRQQYPWRKLALDLVRKGQEPNWNPYEFSGTPLLANFQSAVFYPLNTLFFLLPFVNSWSLLVVSQTILAGLFMAMFLKNQKLNPLAISLGVLTWIGSGFFVAWLEWNTVVHVVIWLPLILLSIDEIVLEKHQLIKKLFWYFVFVFSLLCSLFAGYLQPFFYVFIITGLYLLVRINETKRFNLILIFLILYGLFFVLSLPQLLPTINYISLSARDIDQANWQRPDWFLPWQNLSQFLAPDFFGNPATLNYFGIWNYQEFVAYIGIIPLIFSFFGFLKMRSEKAFFWSAVFFGSLLFALSNPLSKIPYIFKFPFLATAQPSRIIMLTDFSLAILAAFGLNAYMKNKKNSLLPILTTLGILTTLLVLVFYSWHFHQTISLHNLYLPLILTTGALLLLTLIIIFPRYKTFLITGAIILTLFDLIRFTTKFEPFSPPAYLYPSTKTIEFLQKNTALDHSRIAALDDRIIPPNFCVAYKLECISGYDPLYLRRYGEFIAAVERGKPDISSPFGFNRIIVPKNYDTKYFNLLAVKYVLSLNPIKSDNYRLVFEEGQTKIYQNLHPIPRLYFPSRVIEVRDKQDAITNMFSPQINYTSFAKNLDAVVENDLSKKCHGENGCNEKLYSEGSGEILSMTESEVIIKTQSVTKSESTFLVLNDIYYPAWQATIDDQPTKIYITNYTFRGIEVPPGQHTVRFFYQ